MKVTKEDKKIVRNKWKLERDEYERILETSGKKSWAYRIAKETLDEMDKGKIG